MQDYLILKLQGPLQSWGTHTYEDYRPSNLFPTHSGLLGLLAACLGIKRQHPERLQELDRSLEFAVRADQIRSNHGNRLHTTKLNDFHTIINARKVDGKINKFPVISRREYLCDASFTVAIRAALQATISLDDLDAAVRRPYYTPFLGRRSCPLSRPLWEQRVSAESFEDALEQIEPQRGVIYSEWISQDHSRLQLRDRPLWGSKRQFARRYVNIKVPAKEDSNASE